MRLCYLLWGGGGEIRINSVMREGGGLGVFIEMKTKTKEIITKEQ